MDTKAKDKLIQTNAVKVIFQSHNSETSFAELSYQI